MLPVAQTAMSLFGGSLDPVTTLSSSSNSAAASSSIQGSIPGPWVGSGAPGIPDGTAPAPFADLLVEAVGQVQSLEGQAKSAIEGLLSGKGVDVHEAMIASQKAGMGFELVLSLRNKALSAYQQVMGMQF